MWFLAILSQFMINIDPISAFIEYLNKRIRKSRTGSSEFTVKEQK